MQFVSCHNGQIFTSTTQWGSAGTFDRRRGFRTGLNAIEELLPGQAFSRGMIHEILHDPRQSSGSRFFALLIARAACELRDEGEKVRKREGESGEAQLPT